MSGWTVYWITRLDMIAVCSRIATGALLAASLMATAAFVVWLYEDAPVLGAQKKARRWLATLYVLLCLSAATSIFTPTSKEAAAIYVIPHMTSDEAVTEYKELYDLAKKWVADQVEDEK